jgi:hypothetical protein
MQELFEAQDIKLHRLHPQLIAMLVAYKHAVRGAGCSLILQQLAQVSDVDLNCIRGSVRRLVTPKQVD